MLHKVTHCTDNQGWTYSTSFEPVHMLPQCPMNIYMWQSCIEIEGYSIAYFDHIAAVFEVPYRLTSVKGRAHMCLVDA